LQKSQTFLKSHESRYISARSDMLEAVWPSKAKQLYMNACVSPRTVAANWCSPLENERSYVVHKSGIALHSRTRLRSCMCDSHGSRCPSFAIACARCVMFNLMHCIWGHMRVVRHVGGYRVSLLVFWHLFPYCDMRWSDGGAQCTRNTSF
jgi:hypothetical protein